MPVDHGLAAPGQHRVAGQFGTIVAHDHTRLAALPDQVGQFSHYPPPRDRGVGHGSQALSRHVIDDVQHAEPAP